MPFSTDDCARNIPVVKAHLFSPLNGLCLPAFTTKAQQEAGSVLPLFLPQQVSSKTCKEGLIWTRSFAVQQTLFLLVRPEVNPGFPPTRGMHQLSGFNNFLQCSQKIVSWRDSSSKVQPALAANTVI